MRRSLLGFVLLMTPLALAGALPASLADAAPIAVAGQQASGPPLTEPEQKMADALRCHTTGKPTGREPALLVHGTTQTGEEAWGWSWIPAMLAEGYDVCTVDLPDRAMEDIQRSAEYVVHAVRLMTARFGSKVDVMGYSQGPLEPRWAVRWWPDVRASVDDLVGLAPPNQGTDLSKTLCADGTCVPVAWQFARGSNFIAALNSEDETPGDIHYTNVYSRADELVYPQFPTSVSEQKGAANVPIDSLCPGRFPEHVQVSYDAVAYAVTLDAFSNDGPFDRSRFDSTICADDFVPGVTASEAAGHHYVIYEQGGPLLFGQTWRQIDAEPPLRCYASPEGCPGG